MRAICGRCIGCIPAYEDMQPCPCGMPAHLHDLRIGLGPEPMVLEDCVRHFNRDATRLREKQVGGQSCNHQAPCAIQSHLRDSSQPVTGANGRDA